MSGVLVLGAGVVSAAAVDPGESGSAAVVAEVEPGAEDGAESPTGQDPVVELPTGQDPVAEPVAGTDPDEAPADEAAPAESAPDEQVPSGEPASDESAAPAAEDASEESGEAAPAAAPAADPAAEDVAVQAEPITLDLVVGENEFVTIDYRTPLLELVPDLTTATPTLATNPREGTVQVDQDQVSFTAAYTVTVPEVSFVLLVDVDGVTYTVQVNLVVLIEPVAETLIGYSSPGNPASMYYWAGAEWYDLYEEAYYDLEPRVISVDPVDPAVATVSISHEGQMIDFVQNSNATGPFEVAYTVEDGLGRQARGIMRVVQLPQYLDTPVSLSTAQDTAVQIDAVSLIGASVEYAYAYATDYDTEREGYYSREGGRLRSVLGGTSLSYTPAEGFVGTDYLEVEVYDASGQVRTLFVTVEVTDPAGPQVKTDRLATTGSTPGVGALAAGGAVLTGGGLLVLRRRMSFQD